MDNGGEIEDEEEVVDSPSSRSSGSGDLAIVGRLREGFWWGSHPKPPASGSGKANFPSDHWLDVLEDTPGPISESSSGVAGVGDSVEDEEEEYAWRGCCEAGGGSRMTADWTALADKLLKSRDRFEDLDGRIGLASLEAGEIVISPDLSLRLKRREAKRRIVESGGGGA